MTKRQRREEKLKRPVYSAYSKAVQLAAAENSTHKRQVWQWVVITLMVLTLSVALMLGRQI